MGLGQRKRTGLSEERAREIIAGLEADAIRQEKAEELREQLLVEAASHGFEPWEVEELSVRALRTLKDNGWEMTADLAEEFFE